MDIDDNIKSVVVEQKKEIASRADIELLVNEFYHKVRKDEVIGVIFNDVVNMNWEHHIPLIVDFWNTILLDADIYHANAMEPHFAINKIFPLQKEHFDRWVLLFTNTIDEYFTGEVAKLARNRAKGIAAVMHLKMDAINKK